MIWYVMLHALQVPGLDVRQGLQLGLVQGSFFQGALFPRVSIRGLPSLTTTLTFPCSWFPWILFSTSCIAFLRAPSGVWGTKRMVSGGILPFLANFPFPLLLGAVLVFWFLAWNQLDLPFKALNLLVVLPEDWGRFIGVPPSISDFTILS